MMVEKAAPVVKELCKLLKKKDLKVRIRALTTLANLALVIQFRIDEFLDQFFQDLMETMNETQSHEPVILALRVLRRLFRSYIAAAPDGKANFHSKIAEITDFLLKAIKHDYTKTSVEGLKVAGAFLNTLRSVETGAIDKEYEGLSGQFFEVIYEKLNNNALPGQLKQ